MDTTKVRKYAITDNCKFLKQFGYTKVCEIVATRNFGEILEGDLGGWVESEKNLSHEGKCWITDNAMIFDNARVEHDATMIDNAIAFDDAKIIHNAIVADNVKVFGEAEITGFAIVTGHEILDGGNTNEDGWKES